ncbi:hypothetical protein D3C72_1081530 [compost metagenome]
MIIAFLIVRYFLRPPSRFIRYAVRAERLASNNSPSGHISSFEAWILNLIGIGLRVSTRLDILGNKSISRLGVMIHEESVRKDHSKVRGGIIDNLHIQLLA